MMTISQLKDDAGNVHLYMPHLLTVGRFIYIVMSFQPADIFSLGHNPVRKLSWRSCMERRNEGSWGMTLVDTGGS